MAKIVTANFGTLALVPYPAQVPIVQTLDFLTDQNESYNGTEQNWQLRSKPRQLIKYDIPLDAAKEAGVFNTLWGAIRKLWAVPLWFEAQYVGRVTAAQSTIACETALYDFRASSLVMLYEMTGHFQILEASSVNPTYLTVTSLTEKFVGAYLMPVRIGYMTGNASRPTNGFNGKMEVQFFIEDTIEHTPVAPDQYLGEDIYYDLNMTDGGMTDTMIQMREDVIDMDLGKVERRTPWLRAKWGRPYRRQMFNNEELAEYRNFIYRRCGKFRKFWMPSFENNLRLRNTGTIVSTLICDRDSYIEYAADRVHIAIEAGGVWYPRTVSAPTPLDASTFQLTLSAPLNVPASSVSRASYLGLFRLDTDTIETTWNASKSIESAVSIKEISP